MKFPKKKHSASQLQNVVSILSDNFLDSLKSKLIDKEIHKIILSYFDKNREKKTYETYFTFLDEKKKRIVVKSIDITDKIHFEEGLKLSLKGLRDIISKSPLMICNIDKDGQILFVNSAFQKSLGFTEEELLSKSFYNLIEPSYLENNIFDLQSFTGDETKNLDLPLNQ